MNIMIILIWKIQLKKIKIVNNESIIYEYNKKNSEDNDNLLNDNYNFLNDKLNDSIL